MMEEWGMGDWKIDLFCVSGVPPETDPKGCISGRIPEIQKNLFSKIIIPIFHHSIIPEILETTNHVEYPLSFNEL
jgi:hypothetical protein